MKDDIFRKDALDAHAESNSLLGDIVLIRPVSFTIVIAVAAMAVIVVVAFIYFSAYAKRMNMVGQLIPANGFIKVYAPSTSIITAKHVTAGQFVGQGQALLTLAPRRRSSTLNVHERIFLISRQRSLQLEVERTNVVQNKQRKILEEKISALKIRVQIISTLIKIQHRSTRPLNEKHLVKLNQPSMLGSLENDKAVAKKSLVQAQESDAILALKHRKRLAEIEGEIVSIGQELEETEQQSVVLSAPVAGTISQCLAESGDLVALDAPLLRIIPANSALHARLLGKGIDFESVRAGDAVLLRYPAYPYQKFGLARGTILSIAPIRSEHEFERESSAIIPEKKYAYQITVKLEKTVVRANDMKFPLKAGMAVEAEIHREPIKIRDWVLAPLLGSLKKS